MSFEIYHNSFSQIIGEKPTVHQIAGGFKLTEGPVYFSYEEKQNGYLLFTDQKSDAIFVLPWFGLHPFNQLSALSYGKTALFRSPAAIANGMTADLNGCLIIAEAGGRRISKIDADGSIKSVVDSYQGKRFNSPNDVVVKSDGTIWFTDPNYGALGFGSLSSLQDCELPNAVYRFDPNSNEVSSVIEDLKSPNGLAFSPDEKILYVADSGACQGYDTDYKDYPHAIFAFDVSEHSSKLTNKRQFCEINPGFPDGLRLDRDGNLYVGAGDGVHVYSIQGQILGKILLPNAATNLTFGGEEGNVLFICAIDSVWAMQVNAKSCKLVPKIKTIH